MPYNGTHVTGGVVFETSPAGARNTLYHFCSLTNCADGMSPNSITRGFDGSFHGTTLQGGASPTSISSGYGTVYRLTPGGKLTVSHAFCLLSGCPDGDFPRSVIQATDGNLYGFTSAGGGAVSNAGTVFRIGPPDGFSVFYSFCKQTNCIDGAVPNGLIEGSDGNLYGTTDSGGLNNEGTVFRLTTGGTLTTLYTFCHTSGCPDGAS